MLPLEKRRSSESLVSAEMLVVSASVLGAGWDVDVLGAAGLSFVGCEEEEDMATYVLVFLILSCCVSLDVTEYITTKIRTGP